MSSFETFCKVKLRARVATDPELHGAGKTQRAIFAAVVDRPNAKEDRLYVVAWGERAEEVNEKVMRGQLVDVTGSGRVNEWEYDGRHHVRLEVHADTVQPVYKEVRPAAGPPEDSRQSAASPGTSEPAGEAPAPRAGSQHSEAMSRAPSGNVGDDLPW